MKLAVLTAGVWPSEEETRRRLWIFLASCAKFGIEPLIYGMGTKQFPGYRAMGLEMQLAYLKTMSGYTHVLTTDSLDAFFVQPLSEVIKRYDAMGSPPMVISAFYQLGNVSDVDKQYPGCFDTRLERYCYPNRGGFLAEIPYLIDIFERMLKLPRQTGDECFNHYDAWQEGWYRPELDSRCQIFQIGEDDVEIRDMILPNYLDIEPTIRPVMTNGHTLSLPCIWHFSGGYTSQETGKDERMLPWAVKLGIVDCPHSWTRRRDGRACTICEKVEFGV